MPESAASRARPMLLVAEREVRLLGRSRATLGAVALLAAVAWLPAVLLPLRSGALGLASFDEMLPLQIALGAVVLPLLALLAGAELFAGELEDGSLIPALTLPISRRACFAGKCLGRGGALAIAYLGAFASAGAGAALARGVEGGREWAVAAAAGLLLSISAGSLGAAIGAGGRGRVRAFGAALAAWVVLVFALDAVLLTLIVALAPPPPGAVGEHGHDELAAPSGAAPGHDPHARAAEPEPVAPGVLSGGLMTLSPVSLFRLTALAASPGLQPRLGVALPGGSDARLWTITGAGWLVWLAVPLLAGHYRFRRAVLV